MYRASEKRRVAPGAAHVAPRVGGRTRRARRCARRDGDARRVSDDDVRIAGIALVAACARCSGSMRSCGGGVRRADAGQHRRSRHIAALIASLIVAVIASRFTSRAARRCAGQRRVGRSALGLGPGYTPCVAGLASFALAVVLVAAAAPDAAPTRPRYSAPTYVAFGGDQLFGPASKFHAQVALPGALEYDARLSTDELGECDARTRGRGSRRTPGCCRPGRSALDARPGAASLRCVVDVVTRR